MSDMNKTFNLVRTCVFGVASLFAFLELALGAAITNYTTTRFFGGYFAFAALGIATAILTFLTLPVMLLLSLNRKGAVTSMVAIEVGWTWFLWIMWLSVGSSTASIFAVTNCNIRFDTELETLCREVQAFEAFGFLTWIMLFAYNVTLIFLVIRQQMRGNTGVWTGYMLETDFTAAGPSYSGGTPEYKGSPNNMSNNNMANNNMGNFAPQYPPAQQASQPGGYVTQPAMSPQHTPATMSPYPQV
ncbi:hypothetical protein GALMADRAFT_99396 [Galerina marginata CBS 339.88]|uniref:MARVEL domain-containing protein n=1 Tax=Galerina marginata (strain CBS 339.88) TaxID=685588 RepID=A0A067T5U7_GALM3|nr:hypothetical protein GALMADRAFT_99396 [Galerina marginata CBS 339.88]